MNRLTEDQGPSALTVVAIDDDAAILLLIARALKAEGMACHTATNGADGLRLIREHQPDLVLLDIVLVGEDGYTICREIRRTWSAEQLPVVMVTGLEDLGSIQAAYQAGANDFLTKPLHWKHLPYRIRHILQADHAFKALQASEERYQRITAAITDYIYTVSLADGNAAQTIHGPGCLGVTGYRPDELAQDPYLWFRMVADEDRPAVLEQVRRILAGKDPPPIEHRINHKNGTVRWVRNTFVPHCAPDGALVAYDGLVQDITEHKRVEEALRESSQRLELAVLSGSLGIWDRNLHEQTVVWNDRMYEIYGLDRQTHQPTYSSWADHLVHPDDRTMATEAMRVAIEEAKPYRSTFRIVLPGGEIRHLSSNGMVIRDDAGRPIRMIGVNRDRTEQVRAEFERRRLQEERQHSEKLESLGSLAGGIAHDMNNVLAAIMGMASALRSTCPDQDPRASPLDSILHASGRGRDLVKALTEFARKGLEEPHWFDLNDLVRKEAELLGHARLRQVNLTQDLDPALPRLLGDASALGGTIMNLGINALDAMPCGGTLNFRSRALGGGGVELTVTDTGHGMPPEVLARAMEPFYTTKPVGKGTGLGLARVYGTVKAHGGSVEIQSEPGQGTSVRIILPAGVTGPRAPDPGSGSRSEQSHRPLSVLLVDDDDLIQSSTHALLDVLGHATIAVSSGEEALAQLEGGFMPDIVLLDMNMPGLGGAGTLPRLRVLRPGLPVLLATGRADQTALDLVQGYPKVTLLSKPFSIRELRQQLESLGRG